MEINQLMWHELIIQANIFGFMVESLDFRLTCALNSTFELQSVHTSYTLHQSICITCGSVEEGHGIGAQVPVCKSEGQKSWANDTV